MTHKDRSEVTRRELVQVGVLAGLGVFATPLWAAKQQRELSLIRRAIPSTGQKLPVIGLGTSNFNADLYDNLVAVLTRMNELGGTVLDTAPLVAGVEELVGRALAQTGLRNKFFLETKFNAKGAAMTGARGGAGGPPAGVPQGGRAGGDAPGGAPAGGPPGAGAPRAGGAGAAAPDTVFGLESFERSLKRLQTEKVDMLMIHYLSSVEDLMPVLVEQKKAGRARYVGITTVSASQHEQMMEYMRKYPMDFIQVDYNIDNRVAAKDVLPLAMEKKIAVMGAVPFGGRFTQLLKKTAGKELPSWAADFDAHTWSQVLLKYVVSHPAITCVVPNTTSVEHLEENQAAGRGRLPNEKQRKQLEEYWDKIMGKA
jgi:aryl-alcohol dehydrogenase-like predicted oxidoreductase